MRKIFNILFTSPVFDDEQKTRTARYLTSILNIIFIILLLLALSGQYAFIVNVVFTLLAISSLAMHLFIHAGRVRIASTFFTLSAWASLTYLAWVGDGVRDMAVVVYIILIFLASLLGSTRLTVTLIALSILSVWTLYYAQDAGLFIPITDRLIANTLSLTSIFLLFGTMLYFTVNDLEASFSASREKEKTLKLKNTELLELQEALQEKTMLSAQSAEKAELQTSRLQRIASITQQIVFIQEVDTLLPEAAKLIAQNFGFYHVGIFLLSADRKSVELKATNKDDDEALKEEIRAHRSALINRVARSRQPQIVIEKDVIFDLPETKSQMAFPLIYGGTFFGVLDIHSREENNFQKEDVEIFMTLANQLALVMENARQVEVRQDALNEMEEVSQQYLRQEWAYLRQRRSETGYRYVHGNVEALNDEILSTADDDGILNVPVRVRNQVVGVIQLHAGKETGTWSDEDTELVETIADRVALAIENARLLEDTSMQAGKEGALSQFAATISNVSETEKLMSVAVSELRKILGASEVSFELKE